MMVQPKEKKSRLEMLAEMAAEYDRSNPVVGTKYAVEEVTPAYSDWGYYSQDYPESSVVVSPKYDDEQEAIDWMEKHEADKGKFLAVVKFVGRRHTHINWTKTRIK